MNCPNCQQHIANPTSICSGCGWQLSNTSFGISNEFTETSKDALFDVQPSIPKLQISAKPRPLLLHGGYANSDAFHDRAVWEIPLTTFQKLHLLLRGLIPIIALSVPLFFFNAINSIPDTKFLWVIWLIWALYIGKTSRLILIDLFIGIAEVQITRLQKTNIDASRTSVVYYGHFVRIGRLNIGRENYDQALQGAIYQITYSPRSKRLWAMHQAG